MLIQHKLYQHQFMIQQIKLISVTS